MRASNSYAKAVRGRVARTTMCDAPLTTSGGAAVGNSAPGAVQTGGRGLAAQRHVVSTREASLSGTGQAPSPRAVETRKRTVRAKEGQPGGSIWHFVSMCTQPGLRLRAVRMPVPQPHGLHRGAPGSVHALHVDDWCATARTTCGMRRGKHVHTSVSINVSRRWCPWRYRRRACLFRTTPPVCGLIGKPVDLDMYLRNPFIRRGF